MRREILPAGIALLLFGATDASAQALRSAQDAQIDLFVRNRAVAVRDRPQPAYDPLGIRAGGFTAFPGFSRASSMTTISLRPRATVSLQRPCA